MKRVACPSLVVRGEASHLWDNCGVEKMVEVLAQGSRVIIPQAGHWVAGDNKPAFRDAVLSFFQRQLPEQVVLETLDA